MSGDRGQQIAVIGLAGRFPGAASADELWRNVRSGVESIETFSRDELLAAGVPEEIFDDPAYVPARGALDGHDRFDAHLFGFTAREAEVLDPQHRLLLECAVEALDSAGYGDSGGRRVGVFAGCGTSGYLINVYSHPGVIEALGQYQVLLANDKDFLATRVSYKLDLGGPSVTVQTACSTSLVAVHVACQSLLAGECDMALAGGVMSTVPERVGYLFQEQGISSPDGHCRAFDADAAGTVGGSGLGLVVLARLEDALAQGDPIRAVVLGSAINNDGSSKVGYTAPSVKAQARVIAEALAVAGVDAGSVGYVEAHGTATSMGDPVEVAALSRAFRLTSDERGYCSLGSTKANIGHLDAAAGVAGLIKTILALEHREIPPQIHFRRPNPQLDLADSPFVVPTELAPWRPRHGVRRAGVSSLGIGGTNAHVILEEAPSATPSEPGREGQLLVLSAATDEALSAAAENLADHLETREELVLADAAFTLQVGRRRHPHRLALVCRDRADAAAMLREPPPERTVRRHDPSLDRPVVFLFPGQGSQCPGMGRGLYRSEPLFRREIDRAAEELAPVLGGRDLRRMLYDPPEGTGDADWTSRTDLVQPALFAHEHALARLWTSWGVEPRALLGHSIGEWVAACLAGVFSYSDALALVALRGRLMQGMEPGAMTAVHRGEDELREMLTQATDGGLTIAAVNAPDVCVVAGDPEAMPGFERWLSERRVAHRRLRTSHAFHSPSVDPVLDEFEQAVAAVDRRPPRLRVLSNVTGDWLSDEEAVDAGYWRRHLRQPVRFAAALERLVGEPDLALLEVGPGRSLGSLVRRRVGTGSERLLVASAPAPQEPDRDREALLGALGRLWSVGVAFDWRAIHAPETRRRVVLPSYPFERRRYWLDRTPAAFAAAPRRRRRVDDWFYRPLWRQAADLPAPAAGGEGTWVVLADEAGVAEALAPRLALCVERVVTVYPGTELSFPEEGPVRIDPRRPEHHEALLRRIAESGPPVAGLIHLAGVTAEAREPGQIDARRFAEAQERGFYSIVALARALAHGSRREQVRLLVVTNRAQAVGEGVLEPAKATVLAPCRVIPQEVPNVTCRSIDFGEVAGAADRIAARVLEEALSDAGEPTVAYRGGQRWLEVHEPEPRPPADGGSLPLREGGVYLITGGLGRLGGTIARHLASSVRARLVLLGRRALPERASWPERLERDDEIARRIRAVQELEEQGAEVLVAECDLADDERMREILATVEASFGRLDGVVHAAGTGGGGARGLITALDRLACEEQFVAKAYGTLVLDRLLAGRSLDFVVLFSSLSTVLGGLGFSAYAGANRFLEAWAETRWRERGTPWTAIAWDAWRDEGDAAGGTEGLGARLVRDAIEPEEGVEVFRRILGAGLGPRVTIASGDLEERYQEWVRLPGLRGADGGAAGVEAGAEHPRPPLPVAYVEPRNEIESVLATIWSELLGVAPIGVHDDFFDLGGHSLLGIQLNSRLRSQLDLDLPLGALFEHTTVAALGALIEETLIAEIDDLSDEEAARLLGDGEMAGMEIGDDQ